MKTATVVLTEQQAERLAEEERRSGMPTDLLIGRALDAYLGIPNGSRASTNSDGESASPTEPGEGDGSANFEDRPDLWFVGLGRSEHTDTSERAEEILAAEWERHLLVESGLRPR